MKNDLRKAWEFIKLGASVTKVLNISFLVIFMLVGLIAEALYLSGNGIGTLQFGGNGYDVGSFLILASLSFPTQFLVTTDVAYVVQTSSYKKKIQTKMFAEVSLITSLTAMSILVVARVIATVINPQKAALFWGDLPMMGVFTVVILIFTAVMYKYFWAAMIILYVVLFGTGCMAGYKSAVRGYNVLTRNDFPIAANIIIGYALILIGVGIIYLISVALYKKPFSKSAFGAAMSKYVS